MTYDDRKCAVCAAGKGLAAHYEGSPIRVRGESGGSRAAMGSGRGARVGEDQRLRTWPAGDLASVV
jgi:hypothetical protein